MKQRQRHTLHFNACSTSVDDQQMVPLLCRLALRALTQGFEPIWQHDNSLANLTSQNIEKKYWKNKRNKYNQTTLVQNKTEWNRTEWNTTQHKTEHNKLKYLGEKNENEINNPTFGLDDPTNCALTCVHPMNQLRCIKRTSSKSIVLHYHSITVW